MKPSIGPVPGKRLLDILVHQFLLQQNENITNIITSTFFFLILSKVFINLWDWIDVFVEL